jgi:tol-pal system protein YbgF
MIRLRYLLIAIFTSFLLSNTYALAPVVDDSENFAMLDDQEAANEQPLAHDNKSSYEQDEEPALANDSIESTTLSRDNAGLLEKIQGLKQEVQELRGQLEEQAHIVKTLQEQQLAFYKDLDARIRHEPVSDQKDTKPVAFAKPSLQPEANIKAAQIKPTLTKTSTTLNPAEEQISYLAAYELVKNKQYDQAINAMNSFITKFPQGGYSANAQYWLGELYMVKKDYPKAVEHFDTVLSQFPSSSKTAASMLKLGYAYAAAGRTEEAKAKLQQVIKSYPDTNTAQLAISKLDALD